MRAKFETSLGWVVVEITFPEDFTQRTGCIRDGKPYFYNNYFDIEVVSGQSFIDSLYVGGLGILKDDNFTNYDVEKPLDLLKKRIKNGEAWIYISLYDGYYGSPEYKLQELD